MLPTAVYVHLRLPNVRRLLEGITILPIVIPPVVLIVGVLQVAPGFLKGTPYLLALEYVILAMPFAYRAIDAGLRALDLKTVVEASNSLGAGWITTMWRVILPNLTTALLSAIVLTVALVLGEFTMASLSCTRRSRCGSSQRQTSGQVSVAASLLALFVTWLFLMAITVIGTRQSRRTGGGRSRCLPSPVKKRGVTNDHQHRQHAAADGPGGAGSGTSVVLQNLSRAFGATRALDGLSIEIAPASSSRCSARRAAARPRPCASWPASSSRTTDRSWSTARTSRRCRPRSGTWAWCSRATACSRT